MFVMTNTIYNFTVPMFLQSLRALHVMLATADAFAQGKNIPMGSASERLLNDHLIFDQFPFWLQVQLAVENAVGGAAMLSNKPTPEMPRAIKTFPELVARVEQGIAFLETLTPEDFEGAESRKITLPYFTDRSADGLSYAQHWLIPNFYFHLITAYSILRKDGVSIGKKDFIGQPHPFK